MGNPNRTPIEWPDDGVILYDGICILCSGWVRFVIRRDSANRFRFTPIQSGYGRALAQALGIDPDNPDTNAVVLEGVAWRRSDAALQVVSRLPRLGWVRLFRLFPRPVRDLAYRLIARTRYRVFGRNAVCDLGEAEHAGRILTTLKVP